MTWRDIESAPRDGRPVHVKRVHDGRVIKEGRAVWGVNSPDAPMRQWSPGGLDDPIPPDPEYADTPRWLTEDRRYAFPTPTHWLPDPATMTDEALIAAYHACDEEPGDPWLDALVAEIERVHVMAEAATTKKSGRCKIDLLTELRNTETRRRFWSKVAIGAEGECWLWLASTYRGYGSFTIAGRNHKAHRIAWQIANDQVIPAAVLACHECDNPTCVNPAHIEPGSTSKNTRDAVARGLFKPDLSAAQAAKRARTHCKRGHPYEGANLIQRKDGGRGCRACDKLTKAAARGLDI